MNKIVGKKSLIFYPIAGMAIFVLLSFFHDGMRTDRTVQSYIVPLVVGFCVGFMISYLTNRVEEKSRTFERRLSRQREEAAIGRTAAAIAHEVRNPLNALSMGLQRLQMEAPELTPDHQSLVEIMLNALRRANETVTGLLYYARPQAIQPKTMHLNGLVEDLLKLYQSRCAELGIQVTKRLNFQEPIEGDPDLLSQVFENIFKNAIDAQPRGGFITIEMMRLGQTVVLSVQNGGFSLPADQVQSILEPYFTTKTQGTGLGLSIAQRIVQAHKGRMDLRLPEKNILEISICLPLQVSRVA